MSNRPVGRHHNTSSPMRLLSDKCCNSNLLPWLLVGLQDSVPLQWGGFPFKKLIYDGYKAYVLIVMTNFYQAITANDCSSRKWKTTTQRRNQHLKIQQQQHSKLWQRQKISCKQWFGSRSPGIMKVHSILEGKTIVILIDCESTYSFLNYGLASELKNLNVQLANYNIFVANGKRYSVRDAFENYPWNG